ncbi:hypothetical protein GGTG_00583 [Gaeumannomyces tritici R3-111a-1]|uniref:Uncharacterized protein n=1 Tax=Gaeumannomyces tritici (strain R3-111a-1) TaxID=644352 RepID=J3NH45_GAET3|nr:hypothetical protein GGTG_00583 [Gaeumannomyces tritici R3-111a-1]EJT80588.1 hypothetical protein GGTG_00583 [Gaeumannomyces tritici R3-111a-1]
MNYSFSPRRDKNETARAIIHAFKARSMLGYPARQWESQQPTDSLGGGEPTIHAHPPLSRPRSEEWDLGTGQRENIWRSSSEKWWRRRALTRTTRRGRWRGRTTSSGINSGSAGSKAT